MSAPFADQADQLRAVGIRLLSHARAAWCLDELYGRIPFRYPRLFENLCRFCRWEHATLGEVELAANPTSDDLSSFAQGVRYDSHLWEFLTPRGYLILGRMSGGRYDPCAVDTQRWKSDDAPVVRVDHEEVLSFGRLGQPTVIADSFQKLLEMGFSGAGRRTRG
jgi:hypothetical protein